MGHVSASLWEEHKERDGLVLASPTVVESRTGWNTRHIDHFAYSFTSCLVLCVCACVRAHFEVFGVLDV